MWLRRRSSASRMEPNQETLYGRVCLDIDRHSPEEEEEDQQELEAMNERLCNNSPNGAPPPDSDGNESGFHPVLRTPSKGSNVEGYNLNRKAIKSNGTSDQRRISSTKIDDPVNHYKGYFKQCLCGILIVALAYTIYAVNPLIIIKQFTLAMKDGSFLSNIWKVPPIKIYFKVYIFNVTNSQDFIDGQDSKLKYEEIGPYVYSETLVNDNVTWNSNMSVSFTPKRQIKFEPEMSVGDPKLDYITVPNIALLGIASMLHKSSVTMNLALSTLVTYLNPKPIMNMTVEEYLWGYDDNLVEFASKALPTWISFKKFGLLDRMLDEGENRVTIATEDSNKTSAFSIQRFNGLQHLPEWGQGLNNDSVCDKVEGTVEGLLLPRNLKPYQSLTVYRRAFCRPLELMFLNASVNHRGFPTFIYTLADDALDPNNPDNACYCTNGICLPLGLSDLSPCYYKIPVAMSMPHFYGGDPSLIDAVEGMHPDRDKHASLVEIQPDAGVPLRLISRIQLNLVVRKTRFISRVKPFNNLTLPVVWFEVELGELPTFINVLLNLLLITGPVVQSGLIGVLLILGFILLFVANVRYAWSTGFFRSRHSAALISYRKKQLQQQRQEEEKNTIWGGQYTQLIPIPLSNISVARSR